MGLFDNKDKNSRDEVRVNVPDERDHSQTTRESSERSETKLKSQVESKVGSRASSHVEDSGSVSLEDIHQQNQRIIELLESLSGGESSGKSYNNKSDQDNSDVGSGMNELL